MTQVSNRLSYSDIADRVCDLAAEQMDLRRQDVHAQQRIIEDLNCDSLDLVELFMAVEEAFNVTFPNDPPNPIYKSVFTRTPFRLCDLAELAYLQQGSGRQERGGWWTSTPTPTPSVIPFSQLGGSVSPEQYNQGPLHEPLGRNQQGLHTYRRRIDGMVCVQVPAGEATIGSAAADAMADEQPMHRVRLTSFLMDIEPVSTTAYCRFLNFSGVADPAVLQEWFLLPPQDKRQVHELLRRSGESQWEPVPGAERFPMVLVSWFGANAYSLWANRLDWRQYHGDRPRFASRLPSEAQWEYAARGGSQSLYPWGDKGPTPERMRYGRHRRGTTYRPETLPMADVNAELGVSPFGLRHMAGNVWQWCRDWYSPAFYASPEAAEPDAVGKKPSHIRSERGGSWVGPGFLCRSSYRRGRVPMAKGRCLGFRCIGDAASW